MSYTLPTYSGPAGALVRDPDPIVTLASGARLRLTSAQPSGITFDRLGAAPAEGQPETVTATACGLIGGTFADLDALIAHIEAGLPSPATILAARRSALRDIAKARRSALIAEGFAYGGKVIQTRDGTDIANVDSATLAATNNPAFATNWITADNSDLPLDAAGMIAMQAAMIARGNAIFAAFRAVAAQIEAAADLSALDALAETAATFTA